MRRLIAPLLLLAAAPAGAEVSSATASGAGGCVCEGAPPAGTEIIQTYPVGGYVPVGADKLAPVADVMLSEQLARLKASLER